MNGSGPVDVITGCRLHFGLICGTSETGWVFGGFGMMLRNPGWHLRLRASSSGSETVCPDPAVAGKIREVLALLQSLPDSRNAGVRIEVLRSSRLHCGLGAGTQLTLAIARGLEVLWHRRSPNNVTETARYLGRGCRSGVGTSGFLRGGFIVDHGVPTDGGSERVLMHLSVPESWRFVVVWPKQGTGLSGECERSFFAHSRTMSAAAIAELAVQIQDCLIPSIRAADFESYASSVEGYGQAIGRFYAPAQGDVFAHAGIARLVGRLRAAGIRGAAQSSWGPGICIPAASHEHARRIQSVITGWTDADDYELSITEAMNHGATIRSPAPETSDSARA